MRTKADKNRANREMARQRLWQEKVSKLASGAEAALRAEIAKCDLVCANCHRLRTWQRHTRR